MSSCFVKGDFIMALIKCYECGKEISDKATACPNCGAPVIENNSLNRLQQTPEETKMTKPECFDMGDWKCCSRWRFFNHAIFCFCIFGSNCFRSRINFLPQKCQKTRQRWYDNFLPWVMFDNLCFDANE